MKYLIAGLGNPGEEYAHTRHNAGFDVLDAFALNHGIFFHQGRLADIAECRWKGRDFILIKPTTYVNLSGNAVKYWMDRGKVSLEHILVIADELALPLSVLRLRPGGSDGGHNGLKSIAETLGTQSYSRLRFGIGKDYPQGGQVDFVLGQWKSGELPIVKKKIERSVEVIGEFAIAGVQATMNAVNQLVFD